MNILYKSENLNGREIYAMTQNGAGEKLSDNNGLKMDIVGYVIYLDDSYDNASERAVMMCDIGTGVPKLVGTNSQPTVRALKNLMSLCPTVPIKDVVITSKPSNNGRTYFTLTLE